MNKGKVLIVFLLIIFFLLPSILFLYLPTSIFGEASDINHNQRDSEVSKNLKKDFALTNDDLKNALSAYQAFRAEAKTENTTEISGEEFNTICQIIQLEGGESTLSAQALMSLILNRLDEGGYGKNATLTDKDLLSIISGDNLFKSVTDKSYESILVKQEVKDGIKKVLLEEERIHNFLDFSQEEVSGSVKIENLYYFKEKTKPNSDHSFYIENEPFVNPDPTVTDPWDLLYLISAYDASKSNLEGEIKDKNNQETTRYKDLMYGIGEYIVKASFGVEVEVKEKETVPFKYPIYKKEEVIVLNEGKLEKKEVYSLIKEATSKIPLRLPEYRVENLKIATGLKVVPNNFEIKEDLVLIENKSYQLNSKDYYIKTGNEVELIPEEKEVVSKRKVNGLSKGVLLSVLGINPIDNYPPLTSVDISYADFIESSREGMIKTLDLKADSFSFFNSPSINLGTTSGWAWPLDPNGANAFLITSLMGTRESPGGIGSTDHGGTDIGAAYGVAIVAAESGIVEVAGEYGGYGNCVRINHQGFANGYLSLYGHMSSIKTAVGTQVKKGEVIGYVGSTGWSTGPHLHFEVIKDGNRINGLSLYPKEILDKLRYDL